MSKIIKIGEGREVHDDSEDERASKFWRRRGAAIIVASLPDDQEDALAWLDEARRWVEDF